jgi:hypothetical protein
MPTIVQFLHTAVEAEPEKGNDTLIPWNNNITHRRKFILSEGKFLNSEGRVEPGELTFWGEWEAQSRLKKIIKGNQTPPKYLNLPYINPTVPKRTHNTDPNVFGEHFRYIICKQTFFHKILTNLEPNSIILFGSCIDEKFCLDTLFVVSNRIKKYQLNTIRNLFPESNQYYHASVNPIYDDTHYNKNVDKEDSCRIDNQEAIYAFYESVSYEERSNFNDIYSYVPCKIYDAEKLSKSIFRQPQISLDFIKLKQTQGINTKECTQEEIKSYWVEIAMQIDNKLLQQGIFFNTPPRE